VILKGKNADSNLKETDLQPDLLVFASVMICLCVIYLPTMSFAQTIQYQSTMLQAGRAQVQFPMVSLKVFFDINIPTLL
jgi:hypothetical protein